jgi:AmmeMemoRadiSam system radical SAM enzyme/AmmeMemoRadiSam system protein B/AmmeMemoRadiSam system protein A
MKEGDRGFCFVRKVQGGQLVLDTYGRSTGFCIDPIEKKPLNHFYPGTSVLSFGTAGCNLGCQFCQNWDISKSREVSKLSSVAEPELIAKVSQELGCKSVAFTYNDPVVWAEYAMDTARECRGLGVRTVAVTAGYMMPAARKEFYQFMDAANVDLKSFSEEFYRKITYSQLGPVLDTLRYLKHETDVWFEITNLVIPNANDSDDELQRMCDWLVRELGSEVPIHFSAFHPDFRMRDRDRTDPATLVRAREIAIQAGIHYAYVGNVHDVKRGSTYCPNCSELLIERDWYELGLYGLLGGRCNHCGHPIPGRFDAKPGDWGRKRQPVAMDSFRVGRQMKSNVHNSLPIVHSYRSGISSIVGDSRASASDSHTPMQQNKEEEMASPLMSPPVKLAMLKLEDLNEEQQRSVHLAAQKWIVASTCNRQMSKDWFQSLEPHGSQHVMGMFVTLKRGEQLRGCCGFLGRPTKLVEAIYTSAVRTAKEDVRMPAISTIELPFLSLDVSILGSPTVLTVPAKKRIDCVQVGRHGLKLSLGNQSGLLLPSVAVEQGWDAEEFLRGVCRKAGLAESAWASSDAILETFEGIVIEGRIESENLPDPLPVFSPPGGPSSLHRLRQVATENIIAITRGATPNYYALDAMDGTVHGIVLTLVDAKSGSTMANWIKTSLRPGVPLQSSLFELCKDAATVLKQARFQNPMDLAIHVTVLVDPAHHGTIQVEDWDGKSLRSELKHCQLEGVLAEQRAIVTASGDLAAVSFDKGGQVPEVLQRAAQEVKTRRNTIGVYSMLYLSTADSLLASNSSAALEIEDPRPPAVAEGFYPSNPESRLKLVAELKNKVPAGIQAKPALALMTPHAGLRFSGQVAMDVWSSVAIPQSIILIGPKHTTFGRDWAVSPSREWQLPGGDSWAVDRDLAQEIVQNVEGMEMDLAAHAREHGVEIQLPILELLTSQDRRPKIVPIAMKTASIEEVLRAAEQFADLLRDRQDRPLLVISSDLNHYAAESENRRRDRLAIDAMLTGDPNHLIDVCRANSISMCGLVPAALVMQILRNLETPFTVEEIAYDNSGNRGNPDRVVGYAGVVFRAR